MSFRRTARRRLLFRPFDCFLSIERRRQRDAHRRGGIHKTKTGKKKGKSRWTRSCPRAHDARNARENGARVEFRILARAVKREFEAAIFKTQSTVGLFALGIDFRVTAISPIAVRLDPRYSADGSSRLAVPRASSSPGRLYRKFTTVLHRTPTTTRRIYAYVYARFTVAFGERDSFLPDARYSLSRKRGFLARGENHSAAARNEMRASCAPELVGA